MCGERARERIVKAHINGKFIYGTIAALESVVWHMNINMEPQTDTEILQHSKRIQQHNTCVTVG